MHLHSHFNYKKQFKVNFKFKSVEPIWSRSFGPGSCGHLALGLAAPSVAYNVMNLQLFDTPTTGLRFCIHTGYKNHCPTQ